MSQIELVRMQENYDCDIDGCPAGYDGLHPNALGKEIGGGRWHNN
jgi:hypothetical protein